MTIYICWFSKVIRPKFFKIKRKQLSSLIRNGRNIVTVGFPAFLSDVAISLMVIVGNITFISYIGDDGVAEFSVIGFIFLLFLWHIILWFIQHNPLLAIISRVIFTSGIWVYCGEVVSLFIASSTEAYEIALNGVKWFGLGFVFFGINILYVGYLQSVGNEKMANWFVVLRGGLLTILTFVLMPMWLGDIGIWLAVPVAELIAFMFVVVYETKSRKEETA